MDYIGKYVKSFESGQLGSLAFGNSGNDWGLSCGSYQLTLRWGNCIKFLKQYFPEESKTLYFNQIKDKVSSSWPGSFYCSSPEAVKKIWQKCYSTAGSEKFFSYEYEYMKNNFYDKIKIKIINYIDLDKTNRAMQECFWSWSIHRGINGAYKEFIEAIKGIDLKNISHETLFDRLYDVRYKYCPFKRYKKNEQTSEREILRSLIFTPGLTLNISSTITNNDKVGKIKMKYSNSNPPI